MATNDHTPPARPDLESLVEQASDAFWAVVADRFPDATTGDLSPGRTIAFDNAAAEAVAEWVGNNVPAGAATQRAATEGHPAPAHTPGPWHVELAPNGKPFVTNEARQHVCTLYEGKPSARIAADARLIAAAPDLLGCLTRVLDEAEDMLCETYKTDDPAGWPWVVVARRAIDKARGRTG